jgi:molecular chaperone GrpE
MTERDPTQEGGGPSPGDPTQEADRPRVKVTDRRRVRPDGSDAAPAESAQPPVVEPGEGPVLGVGEPVSDTEAARQEAAQYREHLQRLQAEFENYRKRVLKEQTHAIERAAEPFVRRLLEVLDEFELALMAADRKPDFEQFLRGVELVYAKILDILRAEGVERIEAEGKAFDPTLHEALMHGGEGDEGGLRVADVLRQGYIYHGRVLRPAGVKVVGR